MVPSSPISQSRNGRSDRPLDLAALERSILPSSPENQFPREQKTIRMLLNSYVEIYENYTEYFEVNFGVCDLISGATQQWAAICRDAFLHAKC